MHLVSLSLSPYPIQQYDKLEGKGYDNIYDIHSNMSNKNGGTEWTAAILGIPKNNILLTKQLSDRIQHGTSGGAI